MNVRIVHDGPMVIVSFDDGIRSFTLQLEPVAVRSLVDSMMQQCLKAEEIRDAQLLTQDSAILMRAGAPFTLSNHPKILADAAKEAAWNRDLRRYMPGVKSEEIVGTPTIVSQPPKGVQ